MREREQSRFTPRIETSEDAIRFLKPAAEQRIPFAGMGPDDLKDLLAIIERQTHEQADRRIKILAKRIPGQDPLTRWVGVQLGKLEHDGKKLYEKRKLYPTAELLLDWLPRKAMLQANTPVEFIPKPAPKEGVLTGKILQDALEFTALSESPNSVANQLMSPIDLTANGLIIEVRPLKPGETDFTLPVALLGILEKLKHQESGEVFKSWLLAQFTKDDEDAQAAARFLKVLVNFTTFLDSPTHLELWEPPKVAGRQPELLLQPFNSLLNSVEYVRRYLTERMLRPAVSSVLIEVEDLIKLRYGEVFGGAHQTTSFTVSHQALVPTSEEFADLALSIIGNHANNGKDPRKTAVALVNLAETIGVENIEPLISEITFDSQLRQLLIQEAQKSGLMPFPEALPQVSAALERNPWRDAGDINFARIIKDGVTDLEIHIFTGTFGPFTKGHKDLLQRLVAHINTLPETDKRGEKKFQRIVLIVPVTDVSNIPRYEKSAARIGTVEERVNSMLLQLAGGVDQQKVFITTKLQPDPAVTRDLEGRVKATCHRLLGKIATDLHNSGRAADFNDAPKYAYGPDELQWEAKRLLPKEMQRLKLTEPGGILIVRRGWALPVLRNHEALKKNTGVDIVIFTPGTPHSSSTKVIEEIAQRGDTRAVEAAARLYVNIHWSPQAIKRRDDPDSRLYGAMMATRSVSEIAKQLREYLQKELRQGQFIPSAADGN